MNKQRKVVITTTYNELGIIIDTKTEEVKQPKQTDCEYCHEDFDGYVRPIEKNSHAFIRFGMNGWELSLKAKGWHGSAKIRYCPMCGRDLLVKMRCKREAKKPGCTYRPDCPWYDGSKCNSPNDPGYHECDYDRGIFPESAEEGENNE